MALASVRNLVITGHRVIRRNSWFQFIRNSSTDACPQSAAFDTIGDREVVGYGKNSQLMYVDHPTFPFPAVRFREMTPDLLCLREKEKGDWRNLTMEEKKTLYRASFCQTYAEILAPTGKWKSTIGFILFWVSCGVWVFLILRVLWSTELPETFEEDRKVAQLNRIIILRPDPIHGLCSKWDYRCNRWK